VHPGDLGGEDGRRPVGERGGDGAGQGGGRRPAPAPGPAGSPQFLRGAAAEISGPAPAIIHELLADRLPGYDPGDSDLETRVLRALVAAGLAVPVQQHRVRLGKRTFRVDLAYPVLKLAIELDGWEFHCSRSAFDDDRTRANALVAAGWTVLRFTSRSTDAEIVACVRAAMAQCGRIGAA
jgi:very-short-patch-repair endonuclease